MDGGLRCLGAILVLIIVLACISIFNSFVSLSASLLFVRSQQIVESIDENVTKL